MSKATKQKGPLQKRSEFLIRWFLWYARRYLAKNFHSVRLSRTGPAPQIENGPLIVVLNHPSWWDPLMGMLLTLQWPTRRHFVPIEDKALQKYRFFERLGFFGINPDTLSGARDFLRTSLEILDEEETALWITAQGKFTDVRQRPPQLQRGVGHLLSHLKHGTVVPLALEYPFWDERTPEALARFGAPIPISSDQKRSVDEWMHLLEQALAEAQDVLAEEAASRETLLFQDLIKGKAGVGGVFDCWRRLKAWMTGKRFQVEHTPTDATP